MSSVTQVSETPQWELDLLRKLELKWSKGGRSEPKFNKIREKLITFSNNQLSSLKLAGQMGQNKLVCHLTLKPKYFPFIQKIFEGTWGLTCSELEEESHFSISAPKARISPCPRLNKRSPTTYAKDLFSLAQRTRLEGSFLDCQICVLNASGEEIKHYKAHRLILAHLSDRFHILLEKETHLTFTLGQEGCSIQSLEWLIDCAYCVESKNAIVGKEEWKERYLLAKAWSCNLEVEECRFFLVDFFQRELRSAVNKKANTLNVLEEDIQSFATLTQDEIFIRLAQWVKSDPFWKLQSLPRG